MAQNVTTASENLQFWIPLFAVLPPNPPPGYSAFCSIVTWRQDSGKVLQGKSATGQECWAGTWRQDSGKVLQGKSATGQECWAGTWRQDSGKVLQGKISATGKTFEMCTKIRLQVLQGKSIAARTRPEPTSRRLDWEKMLQYKTSFGRTRLD